MKPNRHALIFSTVWPEPDSSAAGVRQMQWVRALLGLFDQITLISPAKLKQDGDWGELKLPPRVNCLPLPMNRWDVATQLKALNPELVVFDRFILEEQFGAIVYEALPNAVCLLETEDLHLVRRARESAREKWAHLACPANEFYFTETALREIASIERADFSSVVSSFEERLLEEVFGVNQEVQSWIPFAFDPPVFDSAFIPFDQRKDFVWIGNFRHAPNADGLRWFKKEIWPRIRKSIPHAKMKVFGAYPSEAFMGWNRDRSSGIEVKGSALTLADAFQGAKVNLAPLRFGAGVKGKILEGFRFGLPVVTTWVGAEGLRAGDEGVFPGKVARDADDFADQAIRLHEDRAEWEQCSGECPRFMSATYAEDIQMDRMRQRITVLLEKKASGALPRFRSRMLRQELMNSRKYFSKWIEEKEKSLSPVLGDPVSGLK